MTLKFRKPFPVWGTLFVIVSAGILCSLGNWQLERLHWKESLIGKIESEYTRDPLQNPFDSDLLKAVALQKPPMAYGSVRGLYHHDLEILIGPRTHEGKPGYHVVTPFSIAGGNGRVLVNRGWVPLDMADPTARLENQMEGMVTLTGMARLPDKPNPFTPHNDPANHTWYSVNPQDIALAVNMPDFPDVVFYAETQDPPLEGNYPIMTLTRTIPPNNHWQYALFWYGMAALLTLIYIIYLVWPERRAA